MSARGFMGAGDVYIERYNPVTGTFDPPQGPFETTKFEIKPNTDIKEMESTGRDTYGQVIETIPLPKPTDFSIDLAEMNKETFAMALMGTQTAFNQGSGTFADAPLTVTKGSWLKLPHENVATAAFVVKDVTGVTTYVLGTDYEVNYRLGWVRIKDASAIAKDDVLHVSGSYGAVTGAEIKGSTIRQIRARLKFDGINLADEQPVILDVHEAVLSSSAALDLFSKNFASAQLKGRLKTPTGMTEPYTLRLYNV